MYCFLRNFAGPVATIFASAVAVAVTGFFAWQQWKIAEQQKDISKNKLRLDLFDRRYECFKSLFPYYDALVSWKGTAEQKEARTNFFLARHQSGFLFGTEVESIFKELTEAGAKVIGFKENPELYKGDPQFLQKSFNEVQDILINIFDDRLNKLKAAIRPFIDFSKT